MKVTSKAAASVILGHLITASVGLADGELDRLDNLDVSTTLDVYSMKFHVPSNVPKFADDMYLLMSEDGAKTVNRTELNEVILGGVKKPLCLVKAGRLKAIGPSLPLAGFEYPSYDSGTFGRILVEDYAISATNGVGTLANPERQIMSEDLVLKTMSLGVDANNPNGILKLACFLKADMTETFALDKSWMDGNTKQTASLAQMARIISPILEGMEFNSKFSDNVLRRCLSKTLSNDGGTSEALSPDSTLREDFRDSSGLIWSHAVTEGDSLKLMSQRDGEKYCESIGAHLPTVRDIERLKSNIRSGNVALASHLPKQKVWSSPIYSHYHSENGDMYGTNYFQVAGSSGLAVMCVGREAK